MATLLPEASKAVKPNYVGFHNILFVLQVPKVFSHTMKENKAKGLDLLAFWLSKRKGLKGFRSMFYQMIHGIWCL